MDDTKDSYHILIYFIITSSTDMDPHGHATSDKTFLSYFVTNMKLV